MKYINVFWVTNEKSEQRINANILSKVKKYYKLKISVISKEEINMAINDEAHIVIFDGFNVKDITLPLMKKLHSGKRDTRTILIPTVFDDSIEIKGYNKNIDFILDSAKSNEYFLVILKSILRRHSKNYRNEYKFSFQELDINLIDKTCKIEGKLIALRTMEFRFLKEILVNKEITKNQLLKNLWNADHDTTRIISQYRHRINKKIAPYKIAIEGEILKVVH